MYSCNRYIYFHTHRTVQSNISLDYLKCITEYIMALDSDNHLSIPYSINEEYCAIKANNYKSNTSEYKSDIII